MIIKITSYLLIFLFSFNSFADCDWTKIVRNKDDTYTYTKDLHLCVGQMKLDLAKANAQVVDLNKAIQLKDLALKDSDSRTQLWMNSTIQLENRVTTINELQTKNNVLFFGLGVVSTILTGFAASRFAH